MDLASLQPYYNCKTSSEDEVPPVYMKLENFLKLPNWILDGYIRTFSCIVSPVLKVVISNPTSNTTGCTRALR